MNGFIAYLVLFIVYMHALCKHVLRTLHMELKETTGGEFRVYRASIGLP